LTGRLLGYANQPGMTEFLASLCDFEPRPRIRPLTPALMSPEGAVRQIFEDKSWDQVLSVALTADGKKAAFSTRDAIAILDLEYDKIRFHRLPIANIYRVELSGDGKRAVFCRFCDGVIFVWDLDAGAQPYVWNVLQDTVWGFALSTDGDRVVCYCEDGTLAICNIATSAIKRIPIGYRISLHPRGDGGFALSGNGKRAIFTCTDKLVVCDLDEFEGQRVLVDRGHAPASKLTGDGRRGMVVSQTKEGWAFRLWAVDNEQNEQNPVTVWEKHCYNPVVAMTADGRYAVVGGGLGLERLFVLDLNGGKEVREFKGSAYDDPESLALSADGTRAISSRNCRITVWDLQGSGFPPYTKDTQAGAVSPDAKRAVTLCYDGSLVVWDLVNDSPPRVLTAPNEMPLSRSYNVALSDNGACAISWGWGGGGSLAWDIDKGEWHFLRLFSPSEENSFTTHVAVDKNGTVALAKLGERKGPLVVWYLKDRWESRILKGSDWEIASAVSSDGTRAVSASHDGTITVWDLNTCQRYDQLGCHNGTVTALVILPDGSHAISGSADGTIMVWDLIGAGGGRILGNHKAKGTAPKIAEIMSSADGKRALSITKMDHGYRSLVTWNLGAKRSADHLITVEGEISGAALNQEGTRVACTFWDHTLKVWDISQSRWLATYTADDAWAWCSWAGSRIIGSHKCGPVQVLAWEE
jgi:WD40 repeat protein